MRDFSVCIRTDCKNENNGQLTREDYREYTGRYDAEGRPARARQCKVCKSSEVKKKRKPLSPGTCYNRTKCINPKQYNLKTEDFAMAVGWKNKRLQTCQMCSDIRKSSSYTFDHVVNLSVVQQFLCGRVGHDIR